MKTIASILSLAILISMPSLSLGYRQGYVKAPSFGQVKTRNFGSVKTHSYGRVNARPFNKYYMPHHNLRNTIRTRPGQYFGYDKRSLPTWKRGTYRTYNPRNLGIPGTDANWHYMLQ